MRKTRSIAVSDPQPQADCSKGQYKNIPRGVRSSWLCNAIVIQYVRIAVTLDSVSLVTILPSGETIIALIFHGPAVAGCVLDSDPCLYYVVEQLHSVPAVLQYVYLNVVSVVLRLPLHCLSLIVVHHLWLFFANQSVRRELTPRCWAFGSGLTFKPRRWGKK